MAVLHATTRSPAATSARCYTSNPPTSGPHSTNPMPFKISRTRRPKENLLHNMEHGGVVIWYNTDDQAAHRPAEQGCARTRLDRRRFVVMTPVHRDGAGHDRGHVLDAAGQVPGRRLHQEAGAATSSRPTASASTPRASSAGDSRGKQFPAMRSGPATEPAQTRCSPGATRRRRVAPPLHRDGENDADHGHRQPAGAVEEVVVAGKDGRCACGERVEQRQRPARARCARSARRTPIASSTAQPTCRLGIAA